VPDEEESVYAEEEDDEEEIAFGSFFGGLTEAFNSKDGPKSQPSPKRGVEVPDEEDEPAYDYNYDQDDGMSEADRKRINDMERKREERGMCSSGEDSGCTIM
jgi:hypothetical protein